MEVEAKFVLGGRAALRNFRDVKVLGGFTLENPQTGRVRDTYLDTPGRLLLAAGYVCRCRATGDSVLITVKSACQSQGAVHRREEIEAAMPECLPPAEWEDGPARRLVLATIGEQELKPLFSLRQVRTTRAIRDGNRRVGELSLDRVRVNAGGERLAFLEAEVELTEGTEEDLAALRACLQDEWGLAPQLRSKFERALEFVEGRAAAHPEPPPAGRAPSEPGILRDDSMAEAARKALLFHFGRMIDHEAGALSGEDIEEVHDMRVATRRMRAALQVFRPYLNAGVMRPFAWELRQMGRALGAVRDLDVFREKAGHYLSALPVERQGELAPLLSAWDEVHQAHRADLASHLESRAYARFRRRFGELLAKPGAIRAVMFSAAGRPAPYRVSHVVPAVLQERYAEVRAFEEWIGGGEASLTMYHQLRIASKGLRYTLEFFSEALGPYAAGLIDVVKEMQDHLGALQDAVVACDLLQGFLKTGTWPGSGHVSDARSSSLEIGGVEVYLEARRAEIRELLRTFPPVWAKITGPEFGLRLAHLGLG